MVVGALDARNSASFIVMDEPLVSTQPSAAIESLEMILEKFVQKSNVQGIVVTHYVGVGVKQPAIEQWHMETLENGNLLTPTYFLKSGLSYRNDAAAMIRARFDTTPRDY
jgi:DNA mismatch repair ATPase MutS